MTADPPFTWPATDLSRLEDAGLNASAPTQQRVLDGWLLRLCPGKAKRARCVNALGAGRLPLADKLALCGQAYREAGLPLIVRVTPFSEPAHLDDALGGRGWYRFDDSLVMARADLASLDLPAPGSPRLDAISPIDFAHAAGALRDSPASQREAHAQRLLAAPVPHRGFVIRQDGSPLACGQYAIEGGLVGLYDVITAPAARGRGLATALCQALLLHARDAGARSAYLQVDSDNHAARAIYRRLGFVDAYAYHYRSPDPEAR